MKDDLTCYKCGARATTKEHVPPACLFPKMKDIGGWDLRKELITVPSCDEHNSLKTNDDEFLMFVLSGLVGNNSIGSYYYRTKVRRAYTKKLKKHKGFMDLIIRNRTEVQLKSADGEEYGAYKGSTDSARLEKCFEHIAYGIFFHHFKERFVGECVLRVGFLKAEGNDTLLKMDKWITTDIEAEAEAWETSGMNPEVFKYQFSPPDRTGLILLRMVFYGKNEAHAVFNSGSKAQFNLQAALIMSGKPVSVLMKNGERIQFNEQS